MIGTTFELFEQHPELKVLAKKTLGEELYDELSTKEQNVRIDPFDKLFSILMEKQKRI